MTLKFASALVLALWYTSGAGHRFCRRSCTGHAGYAPIVPIRMIWWKFGTPPTLWYPLPCKNRNSGGNRTGLRAEAEAFNTGRLDPVADR